MALDTLTGSAVGLPAPTAVAAPGGGSFTQGAPLPNITTSQQAQTVAPSFYTDYLSNLASQGAQAAQGAQYVGAQPLQTEAFQQVGQNVGNYQPALASATDLAQQVGGQDYLSRINAYMDPYTKQVVDVLGQQGAQQIQQYLAPSATAAAVGSGQFGSSRGAAALGQAINQGLLNTQTLQSQALQQGYGQALQAAQNEAAQKLAASQQLGNLATTTQNLGLGDVNALATLGAQQQAIGQNQQLFPMQQLSNEAALLRGYTIPTSTSSTYTGPIPGAYAASPLQQIAGLGALSAAVSSTPLGTSIGNFIKGFTSPSPQQGSNQQIGATYVGTNANGTPIYWNSNTSSYTDANGNPVAISGGEGE